MIRSRRFTLALLATSLFVLGIRTVLEFRPHWIFPHLRPRRAWMDRLRPPDAPRLVPYAKLAELGWEAARVMAAPLRTVVPRGPIGTPHPLRVVAHARDAGWVVMCQARHDTDRESRITVRSVMHGGVRGDDLEPFLVVGTGSGLRIGAYVASDPSGRWIVLLDDEDLVLLDTLDGTWLRLGSAEVARLRWMERPRVASFDAAGERLVYLDDDGGRVVAVVRTLATGQQWSIDHGDNDVRDAWIYDQWVMLMVVEDGPLEEVGTSLYRAPCPGTPGSYTIRSAQRTVPHVVSLAGSESVRRAVPMPGLIRPLGNGLLRNDYWGEIWLTVASRTALLAPAECRVAVNDIDPFAGIVGLSCRNGRSWTKRNVPLVTGATAEPTDYEPWPRGVVGKAADGSELRDLVIECGAGSGFVCGPLRWRSADDDR